VVALKIIVLNGHIFIERKLDVEFIKQKEAKGLNPLLNIMFFPSL
jgi:hypothetical protein